MPDILTNGTHVALTTPLPGHPAGSTGTVHGSWASHTGVIFDSNPGYIRYVPPTYLTTHQDVADVTKAAEDAVLHIIESAWDMDTPCSKRSCNTPAVWWAEHTHCGDIHYRCEPHRAADDERHAEGIAAGHTQARCLRCGNLATIPVQWRAL